MSPNKAKPIVQKRKIVRLTEKQKKQLVDVLKPLDVFILHSSSLIYVLNYGYMMADDIEHKDFFFFPIYNWTLPLWRKTS